jgi:hypothetical protein
MLDYFSPRFSNNTVTFTADETIDLPIPYHRRTATIDGNRNRLSKLWGVGVFAPTVGWSSNRSLKLLLGRSDGSGSGSGSGVGRSNRNPAIRTGQILLHVPGVKARRPEVELAEASEASSTCLVVVLT